MSVDRRSLILGGLAAAAVPALVPRRSPGAPLSALAPYHTLAAALAPDRGELAIGVGSTDDYEAGAPFVLWDVARGAVSARITLDPGGVGLEGSGLIAYSAGGDLLLVAFDTNRLRVMDRSLRTVGEIGLSSDDGTPGAVLVGSTEVVTHGELGLAVVPARGDHGDLHDPALRWLPHEIPLYRTAAVGRRVFGADDERAVALDLGSGAVAWETPLALGSDRELAFSPDGRSLAAATATELRWLDTATGAVVGRVAVPKGRSGSVVWDGMSRRVAVVAERPGGVWVHERTGPVCALAVSPRRRPWLDAPDLASLAFSPAGDRAAIATADGAVELHAVTATPKRVWRTPLVADPSEWLGVFWGAHDRVVAVTSQEVVFLAPTGAVSSRSPHGYPVFRG